MGAQYSHDYSWQYCVQTVAHNYTCKLWLTLWVFNPLMVDNPHLNPCESCALLLACSHTRLWLLFWYFSPVRGNLKGKSHTHLSLPSFCYFPRNYWPVYTVYRCASRGWAVKDLEQRWYFFLSLWLLWRCRHGYPKCDTPFVKAGMQFSENQSGNETFGKLRDITPIDGLSVESKSVRFDMKEIFPDATNAGNRPTGALPREWASTTDKIRPQDQYNWSRKVVSKSSG